MKNCYSASMLMIFDLKITDDLIKDEQFVQKYQELVDSQQFLTTYTRSDIAFATSFLEHYNNTIKQTGISLSITEAEYIVISETVKNIIITHKILHELSIILKDFAFLLLINNTDVIVVSENEKVIRNARHINICYHHI